MARYDRTAAALAALVMLIFSGSPALCSERNPDALSAASAKLYADRPFRIGIIRLSDTHTMTGIVTRTVTQLREAFAPYTIDITEYSSKDLEDAIRSKQVDVFIASSGFFWRMKTFGARDIATMISAGRPDPNHTSAIAFLTRSDNTSLQTIDDMKGLRLSASYPTAFMGLRIGLAEIAEHGYDPETFFSSISYTHTPVIENIVSKLLTREADVAFVQSCWLERQNESVKKQFRVVAPIEDPSFPCLRSTESYPNVTVAILRHTPPGAVSEMARILLSMPATESGERWGLAADLQSVDKVYKLLKLEHYAYLREWSVKRWVEANKPWIAAAFFCLLMLVLHSFIVAHLVRVRTRELAKTLKEKEAVQRRLDSLYNRMEKIRKASIVSQLSSMIAHELAQPVGAAKSYADGLRILSENGEVPPEKLRLSLGGIVRGLERIQRIVEKVRSYSRGNVERDSEHGLNDVVKTAFDSLSQPLRAAVQAEFHIDNRLRIIADRLEAELLFNNLLGNAAQSAGETAKPFVRVTAEENDGLVSVTIENSGRVLSDDDFAQLTVPFMTEKGAGHGLGIPISISLAEANGGHLRFERRSEGGLKVKLTLRSALLPA